MFGLVALLFLIVPVAELFVIVQVAGVAGVLNTIALLILVSIAGTLLIRWQGIELIRRLVATMQQGRLPQRELLDGGLLLLAGLLFFVPGFLSDVLGVALLLPPVRALLRPVAVDVVRRLARPRTGQRVRVWHTVVDVDEVRPDQPSAGSRPVLEAGAHERRTEADGR